MTDADGLLAARFAATRGAPDSGDWGDVLRRARVTAEPRSFGLLGSRRLYAALAAVVAACLVGTAFAFPPVRGALDRFFEGAGSPGSRIDPGSLPVWLRSTSALPSAPSELSGLRLLAEQDGERLLAYRDASGRACLVFGNDSDTCSDAEEWMRLFGGHELLKLASGVGPTTDGRVAVFGVARSSVMSVQLRDGDRIAAAAPVTNGGWVIVGSADPHDSLVGLDREGKTVETLDARSWTWRPCTRESGCPPSRH
jgi:TusA-related sulfurtransferase